MQERKAWSCVLRAVLTLVLPFRFYANIDIHIPGVVSDTGVSLPRHRLPQDSYPFGREGPKGVKLVEGVRYYDGVLMRQQMTDEAAARVIVGGDQDFTLEGWVRTVQGGPLVAKAAADPPEGGRQASEAVGTGDDVVGWVIYVSAGQLHFTRRSEAGDVELDLVTLLEGQDRVGDGEWHHFAVTAALAPSRTGGQTASLFVDAKLAAERSDVVLSADQANGAAVKVGYCTKDFPKLEMSADPSLFTGSGWGGTSAGQEILVGRPVLYGQLAFVTYWARAASPVQITQRVQQWEAPHVPASLDLPEETHVDLYNRECVRKNEAEEELMPFTILLLGNLRSFPLMMHPLERLVCQYHYRRWLIVAAVAERVQHTDRAWWMKQVVPETMIAPALAQLQELNQSHPELRQKFCHVFEATVISKSRLELALPRRLVRAIDIHRDHRGHCAYNEKLGRLKLEYIKIGLRRAEALHRKQYGSDMHDTQIIIVARPDVDLNKQGSVSLQGFDQMAEKIQTDPQAVFVHRNTWGLHDQWFVTSARVLRRLSSLHLSCAYAGIREGDRHCITSEGYLLYVLNLVCSNLYYADAVLGNFQMMRAEELSFAHTPQVCVESGQTMTKNHWADFSTLQPHPREVYPGRKGGGFFNNQSVIDRYCQEPTYCSTAAIQLNDGPPSMQVDELILP